MSKMLDKLEVCIKDWAELADEYKQLELAHKEYRNVSPHSIMNERVIDTLSMSFV